MTREAYRRRRLAPLLTLAAVLAVILDVTLWRWLTMLGRRLSHFAIFTRLERMVDRLSPNWVVAIFVAPFIPLIPILKLGEFWLIAHHHSILERPSHNRYTPSRCQKFEIISGARKVEE